MSYDDNGLNYLKPFLQRGYEAEEEVRGWPSEVAVSRGPGR